MKAIIKRETDKALQVELFYTSKVSGKQMRCIMWLPKSMIIVEGNICENGEINVEGKTEWFLDSKIREAGSRAASDNMERVSRGNSSQMLPSNTPEWQKNW